ncbi:MAG: glycosyltransferase family 39 protein [Rhodocyclales bacterium GT-UBC]|nr:MAG: glycosyltransferase family 39 protein [Rhodocyclales bacterium GT-UBC]
MPSHALLAAFRQAATRTAWSPGRLVERFFASPLSLLLAVLLAFFLNASALPLTDVDEGAFTEATREMLASGNLVSPTLNGQPRHDKPILIYWAQAASVGLLGQSEIAYRLPSLLASLLWLAALYGFCRRHGDRQTALVAGLVMVLSLQVGVIAKAAIADALLNLFLAAALFGIYEFFCASRAGKPWRESRRWLFGIYLALGLGFLTKGPVAVMFPLLISGLFFASARAWRDWLRAVFFLPGWLLFLALVLPWHGMVYLDQGDAFFRGFYLQHNVNRYASTFEGHGGNLLYYFAVLPLVLLPFSGWMLAVAGPQLQRLRTGLPLACGPVLFERFLLIWFAVVFVFFSMSRTQLPHYLLYGCTPLFILLARQRPAEKGRALAFAPVVICAVLLAILPWALEFAAASVARPLDQLLLGEVAEALAGLRVVLWLFAALVVAVAAWRSLPVWQGLLLLGLVQAVLLFGGLAPRLLDVTQGPVREAAAVAARQGQPVVAWGLNQPSFSVYRRAVTPSRLPQAGELVLTRSDRLDALQAAVAPLRVRAVYHRGFVVLGDVEAGAQP